MQWLYSVILYIMPSITPTSLELSLLKFDHTPASITRNGTS